MFRSLTDAARRPGKKLGSDTPAAEKNIKTNSHPEALGLTWGHRNTMSYFCFTTLAVACANELTDSYPPFLKEEERSSGNE